MATIIKKNGTNGTRRDTDYSKGIAKGVKYDSKEEAIMANAKDYAKQDWNTVDKLITEMNAMGLISNKNALETAKIAQCLINVKVQIIEDSIVAREKTEKLFN